MSSISSTEAYEFGLFLFYCYGFNPDKYKDDEIVKKLDIEYLKLSNKTFLEFYTEEQGFDSFEDVKNMCNFIKSIKTNKKETNKTIKTQFENVQSNAVDQLLNAYENEFEK